MTNTERTTMEDRPAPYTCKHGCERDALKDALTTAQTEAAAKDELLRECLRWLPLLDSHEAGSTTDLLCDRIRAALSETQR